MKGHIGRKLKPSWREHMIRPFQGMLHSTQSGSDFGNQFLSMSLISSPLTAVTITRRWKPDKRLSISQVYCTLMTQHNRASNSVSSSSISWYQPHFRISFVDTKLIASKTSVNLNGRTSRMKPQSNSMILIQHWELLNC